jgi:hypothetical protein
MIIFIKCRLAAEEDTVDNGASLETIYLISFLGVLRRPCLRRTWTLIPHMTQLDMGETFA